MPLPVSSGSTRGSKKQDRPLVLPSGGDPPEPPRVLPSGGDPPEPPRVLPPGGDPPEPPRTRARTMNRSFIGAEVNHLWPLMRYVPSLAGVAGVGLARTSEPPCFPVLDLPPRKPDLRSARGPPQAYARGAN